MRASVRSVGVINFGGGVKALRGVMMAAICVIALGSGAARAQNLVNDPNNLVSNPNFTNGLTGYATSKATATTYGGYHVALISGIVGKVQAVNLATNIGWTYFFTFYAAASSATTGASFEAVFSPNADANGGDDAGIGSLFISTNSLTLTKYTVEAVASSSVTSVSVTSFSPGGLYVTGFDVAPAPVTGGGVVSIGALVALLAVRANRRKVASPLS